MALRILPLLAAILSLASTDAFSQPASELISNGRLGTSLFSTVARALPEGEYRAPSTVVVGGCFGIFDDADDSIV